MSELKWPSSIKVTGVTCFSLQGPTWHSILKIVSQSWPYVLIPTDKHVSNTSSSWFYWLRQIRIRRWLDTASAKTLVHAFDSSQVDCCNIVLAVLSKATTDRLQRVLNAAARIISGTHKFDCGLTHLLHSKLHWLDIPQLIQFKLGVTIHRCLQGNVPKYLVDCCKSMIDVASRQWLCSASRHQLIVTSSATGHFLLRVWQPGTLCQTISVNRRLPKTLLGNHF